MPQIKKETAIFAAPPRVGMNGAQLVKEVVENPKTNIQYIAKFGGSSLANAERMMSVYKLVTEQYVEKDVTVAVVLSAMGKTTNNLLLAG
jgi:hypothetical protein